VEKELNRKNKRQIREECFSKIKALSAKERAAASVAICANILGLEEYRHAETVLGFVALPTEPNLAPIIWREDKTWGFSRVEADGTLSFSHASEASELVIGNHGILEPVREFTSEIPDDQVDLILVPGVGFDPDSGDRIGRGKGHYDRYLGRLLSRPNPPILIGVAFSVQLTSLNPEPHDIPMAGIITEHGLLAPSGSLLE